MNFYKKQYFVIPYKYIIYIYINITFYQIIFHSAFTCLKLAIETVEQGVEYVQS